MPANKNELEMILELGESLFSATKATDVLGEILKGAKMLCHAERATLFLANKSRETGQEMLTSYLATDLGEYLEEISVPAGLGIVGHTYKSKTPQIVNKVEESPYFLPRIDQISHFKTRSIISLPLLDSDEQAFGVLQILNRLDGPFSDADLKRCKLLSLLTVQTLERIESRKTIKNFKTRIANFKKSQNSNLVLTTHHEGLKQIYEKIGVVANSNSSVLVLGESGTGKEVVARLIHEKSDRKDGPFVAVNCAAIPKELFEAEMFGIARGAATGVEEREGLIRQAAGGTLFLDEIGEMPMEFQSKLLRVLQQKSVTKIGDRFNEATIDFRLVSATNRKLKERIREGGDFREDLFFRINVFEFALPPLRERVSDIPLIANELIRAINQEQNFTTKGLSSEAMAKLQTYSWPGNIRELKNVIERACVLAQDREVIRAEEILIPEHGSSQAERPAPPLAALVGDTTDMDSATKKFQKVYALRMVENCQGNKTKAAKDLRLSREGLRKILNRQVA